MEISASTVLRVLGTQKLYLIRGLPGSGKSTLAQELLNVWTKSRAEQGGRGIAHHEADDFFYSGLGFDDSAYAFDPRYLGAAHDMCYANTMHSLRLGSNVVVANTFSTVREIERYTKGVERAGLDVSIVVIRCAGNFKSVHGVPKEVKLRMKNRWEVYPGETLYMGEK